MEKTSLTTTVRSIKFASWSVHGRSGVIDALVLRGHTRRGRFRHQEAEYRSSSCIGVTECVDSLYLCASPEGNHVHPVGLYAKPGLSVSLTFWQLCDSDLSDTSIELSG